MIALNHKTCKHILMHFTFYYYLNLNSLRLILLFTLQLKNDFCIQNKSCKFAHNRYMHMQAYYFVPLKEGSLYWLLLNLSSWYDTCFHVYLTKSKFKMICTTLYKINIYTTYMHYIQDICTGTCSTTFFHTAQVRNLKRMNVVQWYQSIYFDMLSSLTLYLGSILQLNHIISN